MKKKVLLLLGIFYWGGLYAQVGINIKEPLGILHIDPLSDTVGTNNVDDDIVFKENGDIGIGTITPQAKVHIKTSGTSSSYQPGFILDDGNQGENKVLACIDNTGLATWKDISPLQAVSFKKPTFVFRIPAQTTPNYYYTGSRISLPPGRWVVMVVMFMMWFSPDDRQIPGDDQYWVNTTLSDDSLLGNDGQPLDKIKTLDLENIGLVSGQFWSGSFGGILSGSFIINNQSTVDKQYYYMLGGIDYSGSFPAGGYASYIGGSWHEDNIIAYRIPK